MSERAAWLEGKAKALPSEYAVRALLVAVGVPEADRGRYTDRLCDFPCIHCGEYSAVESLSGMAEEDATRYMQAAELELEVNMAFYMAY